MGNTRAETRRPLYEVEMYDPETDTKAFLVVDSLLNGVAGGGIRMTSDLTLDEVRRLAKVMTHKFSAVRVPVGGAKSGIAADPGSTDKKNRLRAFARMIKPFLKELYVAGEDMGTNAEDLMDIYAEAGTSWTELARKKMSESGIEFQLPDDFEPSAHGGANLEEILTGYGLAEVTEEACGLLELEPGRARVLIQGFGTVGGMTARFLSQKGFPIVAVADILGTIYRPEGLPVDQMFSAKDAAGTIDRSRLAFEYEALPPDRWLEPDAEIVIPAAVADTIHRGNVSKIKAKLVVEAANIPVTEEAEHHLFQRGIAVIPDFIANAGAAGGFGMILTGQVPLEANKILGELGRRLRETTREVLMRNQREGIPPRRVAERIAEERLREARKEAIDPSS